MSRRVLAFQYIVFLVFGALLGVQKGRQVEISNSFELAVDIVNDSAVLDKEYFSAKEEQCEYSIVLTQAKIY